MSSDQQKRKIDAIMKDEIMKDKNNHKKIRNIIPKNDKLKHNIYYV